MKSGGWDARTNFVPGRTKLNLTVIVLFLAYLATSGCSNRADPRTESSREESAVRSLIQGQNSLDWINDTLTVRGYKCADTRDLNGTRMVVCEKIIAWEGHCNYRVLVQRIETRPGGEYEVQSTRPCILFP